MTGEVTLRGRVLPIGGLKEKILAAKRAHITTVILPKRNKKDLDEIPKHLLKGLQFVFAETMDDVIKAGLRRLPVSLARGNGVHNNRAPKSTRKPLRPAVPAPRRPSRPAPGIHPVHL